MAVEQLPRVRLPRERSGPGERVGRAEAEVCPTNSFPTLMLRPGYRRPKEELVEESSHLAGS